MHVIYKFKVSMNLEYNTTFAQSFFSEGDFSLTGVAFALMVICLNHHSSPYILSGWCVGWIRTTDPPFGDVATGC